jgi:hypothetical protein
MENTCGIHSRRSLAIPGSILSPKTIGQSAAIFWIYFSCVICGSFMFSADMLAENQALLLQFMQKNKCHHWRHLLRLARWLCFILKQNGKTFWLGFPAEFNPRMTHPFP